MIVNGDPDQSTCIYELLRNLNVRTARSGIARRVVMGDDYGSCAQIERPSDDLAHVNLCGIDGALAHEIVADQPVLCIEMEHADMLPRLRTHFDLQIILQGSPAGEHRIADDAT